MAVEVVNTQEALRDCLNIRDSVFIEEQGVPPEIEHDAFDVIDEAVIHHLLLRDESRQPVATARVMLLSPEVLKAQRVAVLRAHRGKGYGRVIMGAAEAFAKQHGARVMVLDAQVSARAFYLSLGYVQTTDVFEEAGIDHVSMVKPLI